MILYEGFYVPFYWDPGTTRSVTGFFTGSSRSLLTISDGSEATGWITMYSTFFFGAIGGQTGANPGIRRLHLNLQDVSKILFFCNQMQTNSIDAISPNRSFPKASPRLGNCKPPHQKIQAIEAWHNSLEPVFKSLVRVKILCLRLPVNSPNAY